MYIILSQDKKGRLREGQTKFGIEITKNEFRLFLKVNKVIEEIRSFF
jgi:hypothetical protein